MKSFVRHLPRLILAFGALLLFGGCVYDPAYYHRNGVVYDDDAGGPYYDDYYAGPGYYPGYYYGPAYYPSYEPWYGWPFGVGLGFSYYGGGHHHGGHHWSGGHGSWHGSGTSHHHGH